MAIPSCYPVWDLIYREKETSILRVYFVPLGLNTYNNLVR